MGTNYLIQNPYNTSYTTLGTTTALYSGTFEASQSHLVLLPSSYELAKEEDGGERCFTVIILSGSLILLATVSASLGFILGLF